MRIPDRRRGEGKLLKKDQQARTDVLDEIASEIVQDHPKLTVAIRIAITPGGMGIVRVVIPTRE